ncbi:hypothetical protein KY285_001520 [Solanum tuberosum]|nr:hypothetical protein KY285_001520 [Solanum tuberosum]
MDEVNEFSIEEGLHQVVILKFSYGKPDLHELRKVIPNQLVIKDLPPNLLAKKSLLSIASAVGKPIAVEKATQERTKPSTARVKLFFVDKDSSKVIEHYQEFVYDNLPRYCIRQGHDENSCRVFLGKVGAKNQNDATDKGMDVEQYQGDARDIMNAKFQSKSNKEEQRQLVPDDNSGEGRDSLNNLGVIRDATVDQSVANSSKEAITFSSNNEENLENKGKSIEAASGVLGKTECWVRLM